MKINQYSFSSKSELSAFLKNFNSASADLFFVFGDKTFFQDPQMNAEIHSAFKGAMVAGCSTSGEIAGTRFSEESLVISAVKLEKSRVKKCCYKLVDVAESSKAGETLARELNAEDLKHVFILSDGINVNGTRLIEGINSVYDEKINVSGGLAGDNAAFEKTFVADMDNNFVSNCITAIGFYGDAIQTGSASFGGWNSFGIDRQVTRSKENIVYEIDGKPALELYKSYLGDMSKDLPGSALFFPLEMRMNEDSEVLVRTVLGVSEAENSLTFAGNIPEGSSVRLMKTNVNRVIDGAGKSSSLVKEGLAADAQLVLMVSCVGRKLVLKQLTQDEVEAVTDNFGQNTMFTGFYSNGEISKAQFHKACSLHNQTMTVTALSEI
jgi:hypothetical protein